jgi:Concanavalin A-like lectin/glucanases superfamily
MSTKKAILGTLPTSYWPLDDLSGFFCHDELDLHEALAPADGVSLAVVPFGASQAPYFDGELGSVLTIDSDLKYSHAFANALSVAAWICPLALDNAHTAGTADRFVHFVEKAVGPSTNVEWALRLYNQTNPNRHSRLSFYTFNLGSPAGEGNGAFMEAGVSANDETPIEIGKWVFVVGQAEPWISATDRSTGCILWKQAIEAKRIAADKYGDFNVHPHDGSGPITVGGTQTTGFKGAIAHFAIWNRLLSAAEIASIWTAGANDLRTTAMYHSYV